MRGLLEEPNDGIALTLTTTGSSGASTYNPATGDLNIPIYSGGGGIDGTMVLNRIPFGLDADTLQTSANLTFDGSLQTITADSLGVTQDNTKGFFIRNTTPAAAGAQQISPSIHWQGQGWKTTATAESRPVDFRAYVYTYQGSTNPNGMWFLESSVNSGAYNAVLGVGLAGDLYLRSGGSGLSGQVLQSGGASVASSWLTLNSIATAGLSNGSGTTASGTAVNWAGTLTTNADIDANNSHRIMISNIANNHAGISYATNEPKVTWDIDGSWGLRRRLVDNTEHTVEYFDSIISVKTDSSTGAVVLPDASTSTGRIITVKFYDNTSVYNIGVSASSGNVQSASDFSLGGSYSMPITGQRAISWQSNGTDWEIVWTQGIGDVVGPASATDNNVVFFDGTTGKLIKDSGLTLSGSNTGDQTTITGNAGSATILQTTRTLWGQNFNGSANVTGSLTAVGNITGGASSMTILAGTGASRTLTLQTTSGGAVAQSNLVLNDDLSTTVGGTLALGTNSITMTGSIAATGARATKVWATDVESTNMYTVGGTSLSSTFQGLDTQLTSLAALTYAGNGGKFIRLNAGETDFEFTTIAGGGNVSNTGTPLNNQLAIWTDATTIEGDASVTYDGTSFNLATGKNFQIAGATILADAAGTTTLSNIDALDATTESTIESAIDTLANLTSIQGLTVTLADAGADALLGWDDSASAYQNLSAADARTALGLGTLATQSGTFSGTSSGTNTGDQNIFQTIAVSGQSNVVADSATDTLTLAAGTNITITTDAGTDTITINATGGGSGLTHPQVMARLSVGF